MNQNTIVRKETATTWYIEKIQKEEVMVQPIMTFGDRPTEVPEGHGDTNLQSPTPNGQMQKPQTNADLEEQINKKVNTQIESKMEYDG